MTFELFAVFCPRLHNKTKHSYIFGPQRPGDGDFFICNVIGSHAVKEPLVPLHLIAKFLLAVTISSIMFISSVFKCVFEVNPKTVVQNIHNGEVSMDEHTHTLKGRLYFM